MAFKSRALQRYHETHKGHNDHTCWFHYTTDDVKAEILTAGYFNDGRSTVRKGDIIEAAIDLDGTPQFARLIVTAADISGDVTVAELV